MSPSKTHSPYFRHKRRRTLGDSPYFSNAPSSPFGAMQSLGSLWQCLGASIINSGMTTHIDPNSSMKDRMRNTLRQFESCPVFQKRYKGDCDNNDRTRHLEKSVRHLCAHRCYYRAYAPARAWWSWHDKVQAATSLPVQSLLQGWSCILLPERNQVAFVDPSHRVIKKEQDALQQILGAQRIQRRVERTLALTKRVLFDDSNERPTKRPKSSCPRRIVDTDSPFGLLEELFVENPFQLLLSTILLNRTTRIQVDPVLYELLQHWSTPESLLEADFDALHQVVRPLGMGSRRAKDVMELYYCGPYAQDAYRLFIQRNASIEPLDPALCAYARYQRGVLANEPKKALAKQHRFEIRSIE